MVYTRLEYDATTGEVRESPFSPEEAVAQEARAAQESAGRAAEQAVARETAARQAADLRTVIAGFTALGHPEAAAALARLLGQDPPPA